PPADAIQCGEKPATAFTPASTEISEVARSFYAEAERLRAREIGMRESEPESRSLVPERFFFFSSRRRHTRWPRDWSSDVCSSDLHSQKGQPLWLWHRGRRLHRS